MATNIRDQEDALFTEWEKILPKRGDKIARDGVVDESEYNNKRKTKYKLVFVLKRPHDDEAWDLRSFLKGGGHGVTWNNIVRWAQGLLCVDEELQWEHLEGKNKERRMEYLPKICVVNLEKTPSKEYAEKSDISDAVDKYGRFLRRQFELYEPDITICCGTGGEFDQLYNDRSYAWKETTGKIKYVNDNGKIIIKYKSPLAREYDQDLYDDLINAAKEIFCELY